MREFPILAPAGQPVEPGHRCGAVLARLALAGACALAVSACVSAREQLAMDRGQCADYGFEPGTDAFAQCMMGVTQHREMLAQNRLIALQNQRAAQEREEQRRRDLNRR